MFVRYNMPSISAFTVFDEQKEMISTSGYFHVKWTDEYLVWNKDQYNGTTELYLVRCQCGHTCI